MTPLTLSEARRALLGLPERRERSPEKAVGITRRGRTVRLIAHECAKKHLGVRRIRPRKLLLQRRLTR